MAGIGRANGDERRLTDGVGIARWPGVVNEVNADRCRRPCRIERARKPGSNRPTVLFQ